MIAATGTIQSGTFVETSAIAPNKISQIAMSVFIELHYTLRDDFWLWGETRIAPLQHIHFRLKLCDLNLAFLRLLPVFRPSRLALVGPLFALMAVLLKSVLANEQRHQERNQAVAAKMRGFVGVVANGLLCGSQIHLSSGPFVLAASTPTTFCVTT